MGKILRERCCNPFRVPGHLDASGSKLLAVQPLVRDRLPHVPFEGKVCVDCRNRVHELLRKRRLVKPDLRSGGSPQKRLEDLLEQLPPPIRRGRFTLLQEPVQQHQQDNLHSIDNHTVITPQASSLSSSSSHSSSGLSDDEPPPVNEIVVEQIQQQLHHQILPEEHSIAAGKPANKERGRPNLGNSRSSHHYTMSKRNKLPLIPADADPNEKFCCFCGTSEDNEIKFGKFYHQDGIDTHYYCLLLSSNMEQKGNDDEGILGFLAEDIQKEIKRGRRLICSHCRRSGATLGCCNAKCKKIFHFPCGLENGSLHQFFGEFRSYCTAHRPKQKIDDRVKKEIQKMTSILCYICYESVQPMDNNNTLWAPCCKKNAWFHRSCVQQLAMSAGYFFKCPLCNNKREFQTAMLEYGIYIPRQDASWELVPNAFEELLYRHDRCDAKPCQCPKGRTYSSSNGKWELALCRMCGSQGTHVYCGKLKWTNPQWECPDCLLILNKPSGSAAQSAESTSNASTTNSNTNVLRRETPTVNVIIREYDEDSDSDISVGNETVPFENNLSGIASNLPAVKLRPGPKSFKLQQVEKLKSSIESGGDGPSQDEDSSSDSNVTTNVETPSKDTIPKLSAIPPKVANDIVCLDSDDDAVEILCESRMPNTNRNSHQLPKNTSISKMSTPHNQSNHPVQSSISSYPDSASPTVAHPPSDMPTLTPAPSVAQNPSGSPVHIVISNVTSVDPAFFESVPGSQDSSDESPEMVETYPTLIPTTAYQMKRVHPDEDTDCLIMTEGPKRARYEEQLPDAQYLNDSGLRIGRIESSNMTTSSTLLPAIKQSPSKAMATSTTMVAGPSGVSTAYLSNLHGNAATSRANDGTNQSNGSTAALAHARNRSELPISADGSGPDPVHSTSSCDNRVSKSKRPTINRTGLIPKYARLSDLKFKIRGDDFELSYGAYRIQINMNRTQDATKSNEPGSIKFPSLTSFLELNNRSTESSKNASASSQPQLNDAGESSRRSASSRAKRLRSSVCEDDNTLLEHPNTIRDSQNVRSTRKSTFVHDKRLDRADLKENWDPEVSSSTNNSFDTLNNNNPTSSADSKEGLNLAHANSAKDDGNLDRSSQGNPSQSQRLLRRSSRHTRHCQSAQESNIMQNGESADSSDNHVISSASKKSSQTTVSDQSVRSSRSQKFANVSSGPAEGNEHLKNVEMNDSKIMLVNQVNGLRTDEKIGAEVGFKVRIDLQKISKLLNAKPDLFFNTGNNGVRKLRVHKKDDEKFNVELESDGRKFLVKSRSFDCLLNLSEDEDSTMKSKSKSLANLSRLDNELLHWSTGKDFSGRKVRRSARHKTRLYEKPECFR